MNDNGRLKNIWINEIIYRLSTIAWFKFWVTTELIRDKPNWTAATQSQTEYSTTKICPVNFAKDQNRTDVMNLEDSHVTITLPRLKM